jgi:methyltransferase (TIGR00027 family)
MTEKAAKTGADPTVIVAVEQYFPKDKRIIDDKVAYNILSLGYRTFVWFARFKIIRNWLINYSEKDNPGIWGGILCRKRYINDKIEEASSQIEGVVNLGAGFDTRTYSMEILSKFPVWELDQYEVMKPKQDRIKKIFGKIPDHVTNISIDFDKDDVSRVLADHGYINDMKILFIWEAVTQYLEESSVNNMFKFLRNTASGSKIVFTYVRKDFIEGKHLDGLDSIYNRFVKTGTWKFGMNPEDWPVFLKKYGWQIKEDVGADDITDKYVKATGRKFKKTSIERIIYAEKI